MEGISSAWIVAWCQGVPVYTCTSENWIHHGGIWIKEKRLMAHS